MSAREIERNKRGSKEEEGSRGGVEKKLSRATPFQAPFESLQVFLGDR